MPAARAVRGKAQAKSSGPKRAGSEGKLDIAAQLTAKKERIAKEKAEEAVRRAMPGMPVVRPPTPPPKEEEEEKIYVPPEKHLLSRKPPSRRLYRDLSQQPVIGEPNTAAKVMELYDSNKLYAASVARGYERVEDDKWLREGTAGKWFKARKSKMEVDDDMDEEPEKIMLKLTAEEQALIDQEKENEERKLIPTYDIHDYTGIRATNDIGPLRMRKAQQYVMPVYARVGKTKFAEETFRPGGILEANQGLERGLGRSRSDARLPVFSTAGDASAHRALVNIARWPIVKDLMHSTDTFSAHRALVDVGRWPKVNDLMRFTK